MTNRISAGRTIVAAGLTLAGAAGAARAQPVTGFYVAASVGPNLVQNETAARPPSLLELGAGPGGTFSTGYGLGNGFRFELEGSLRSNDFDRLHISSLSETASGNEMKYGAMVNLAYDFNIHVPYLIPYVGAGVGYQWAHWNDLRASAYGYAADIGGTSGSFAYQAFADLSIPIRAIPGLSLTAEYRFLGMTEDRKYNLGITGYSPQGAIAVAHGTVHPQDDFNHSILFGLRYDFDDPNAGNSDVGRPPPVIVPAP